MDSMVIGHLQSGDLMKIAWVLSTRPIVVSRGKLRAMQTNCSPFWFAVLMKVKIVINSNDGCTVYTFAERIDVWTIALESIIMRLQAPLYIVHGI